MELRASDGHKLNLKLICPTCKKEFYSRPGRLGKGKTSIHCSLKCYHKRGSMNPRWKGGKINHGDGYTMIYSPQHPYVTKLGYILEHRLVMEKKLGRYLKPDEVVHHLNHNKQDNSIENLQLTNNQSEHARIHGLTDNHFKGKKHSQESLRKMRKAKLGKKANQETKIKMSLKRKGIKKTGKSLKAVRKNVAHARAIYHIQLINNSIAKG